MTDRVTGPAAYFPSIEKKYVKDGKDGTYGTYGKDGKA